MGILKKFLLFLKDDIVTDESLTQSVNDTKSYSDTEIDNKSLTQRVDVTEYLEKYIRNKPRTDRKSLTQSVDVTEYLEKHIRNNPKYKKHYDIQRIFQKGKK